MNQTTVLHTVRWLRACRARLVLGGMLFNPRQSGNISCLTIDIIAVHVHKCPSVVVISGNRALSVDSLVC